MCNLQDRNRIVTLIPNNGVSMYRRQFKVYIFYFEKSECTPADLDQKLTSKYMLVILESASSDNLEKKKHCYSKTSISSHVTTRLDKLMFECNYQTMQIN